MHFLMLSAVCTAKHYAQPNQYEAFVFIKGPAGQFEGYLLFDSSSEDELKMSQQKAQELGILTVLNVGFHGITNNEDALRGIVNQYVFFSPYCKRRS